MSLNCGYLKSVLIYLSKKMLQITSKIIFTYFWIIDVLITNLFQICLKLKLWTNLYNTIATIFLILMDVTYYVWHCTTRTGLKSKLCMIIT
jgi:hypothetical protein